MNRPEHTLRTFSPGPGLALAAALLLLACDDPGTPPDGDAAVTCDPLWTVTTEPGATATARVEDGSLLLEADAMWQGPAIEVTQAGLTGSFDATATFEAFTPGGAGAYLALVVDPGYPLGSPRAEARVDTYPQDAVSVTIADGSEAVDTAPAVVTRGTLRLRVAEGRITATAEAGGARAEQTADWSGGTRIGLRLGATTTSVSGRTTVYVTRFEIAGGGGAVRSDGFACGLIGD